MRSVTEAIHKMAVFLEIPLEVIEVFSQLFADSKLTSNTHLKWNHFLRCFENYAQIFIRYYFVICSPRGLWKAPTTCPLKVKFVVT